MKSLCIIHCESKKVWLIDPPGGRLIDCDNGAFGAIRVMVNTNQMGEAAGTAAHLALDGNCGVGDIDVPKLRRLLRDGGSKAI